MTVTICDLAEILDFIYHRLTSKFDWQWNKCVTLLACGCKFVYIQLYHLIEYCRWGTPVIFECCCYLLHWRMYVKLWHETAWSGDQWDCSWTATDVFCTSPTTSGKTKNSRTQRDRSSSSASDALAYLLAPGHKAKARTETLFLLPPLYVEVVFHRRSQNSKICGRNILR